MKLERLEIVGFKSFADRTTIRFNPGVTAIVGPNGCGKTNITDAIRWVLGEQRPTALRGSSMQEVIFSGTRDRKPVGMAEVTLSFTNALGLIPIDYAEVAITRRVFRGGESHYLINNAACGLKDVRDLFMGTGAGSSAYSLIEQKMVDAILSDRAEERRLLFEEAAGVTRYKARRKAALRKLEATEEDLRRLEDVLNEVRRNTNSLRRQVGRARRFADLQREELHVAVALARAELAEIDARETPLRESIRALEDELSRGAAERAARESQLERLEGELAETRGTERRLRGALDERTAAFEALERERVLAEEGRRQAASEAERLQREIEEHADRARVLRARRRDMEDEVSAAVSEADAARSEADARKQVVEELSVRFESARAELASVRAAREQLSHERLQVEAELARARASCETAAARRAELEASLTALRMRAPEEDVPEPGAASAGPATVSRAEGEEALAARVTTSSELLHSAREALRRSDDARAAAERDLEAAETELGELAACRREIVARLETIEQMEGDFAGFGEGARHALEARATIAPRLRGPLGVEVEVAEARYLSAVEAYLDLYLDALVTPDSDEAHAVIEFWRERNQAGAVWPLSDTLPPGEPEIDPAALEGLLCRGTEAASLKGELDSHREALFGRLLLAEDLPRATELRRRLNSNGSAGWYVVAALTGEILEPSGIVRLPHRKTDSNGASRFHRAEQLRVRLQELAAAEGSAGSRLDTLRALAATARSEQDEARARVDAQAADLEAAERALARACQARLAAAERAAEVEREMSSVADRHACEEELAQVAAARAGQIAIGVEAAEAETASREALLEAVRLEREQALRELGAAELLAQERAAALATLRREARYLDEATEEQERLAKGKAAELERQRERGVSLEADSGLLLAAAAERHAEVDDLRAALASREEAVRVLESERFSRENEARTARRAHEHSAERLHVEEMRLAELVHRRQSIHAILETEFGHPLPTLMHMVEASAAGQRGVEAGENEPPDELPTTFDGDSVDELREKLRAVRDRKSALGPVNLLALQEFGSEKERLDFLEGQHADLVRSRDDLRQAIRKINATARELFVETFARARENFQVTFGTLFEGGRADITLVDEADPLESPIDITASPRGKRIQSVNLLSGGERALTALSLLFAIYLVKPSPFCILDEVDAPLDDANIGRFLRMVRTFSDRIQFIIVTHNKRTMEAADFLYGVTMEEPGVSTLVSVAFERRDSAQRDLTFDTRDVTFDTRDATSSARPSPPEVAGALVGG